MRFLLDENLSHETAEFLSVLGYDVRTVVQFDLGGLPDEKIVEKAISEGWVLITHDLDFGEIFYFSSERKLGVIVLRLRNQTVKSVNKVLSRVLRLKVLERISFAGGLVVVEEDKIRIRKK